MKNYKNFVKLKELSSDVDKSVPHLNNNSVYGLMDINPSSPIRHDEYSEEHISYKLNNVCHRSDDFIDVSSSNRAIFAGCSMTFGEYLPEEFMWSKILFERIKKPFELDVFNVLSFPGANAQKIVTNIFKYIDNYGLPKYIFILLPDPFRYYGPSENGDSMHLDVRWSPGYPVTGYCKPYDGIYQFQQAYRLLHIFCKQNGIKLYATSWDDLTNQILADFNFDTSFSLDNSIADRIIDELDNETLNKYNGKFLYEAADGVHAGYLSNMIYAENFYLKAINDIKN